MLSQKERDQYCSKPPADLINAFVKSLRVVYGDDAVEPGRRCATVEFERNTKDKEGKVLSMMPFLPSNSAIATRFRTGFVETG